MQSVETKNNQETSFDDKYNFSDENGFSDDDEDESEDEIMEYECVGNFEKFLTEKRHKIKIMGCCLPKKELEKLSNMSSDIFKIEIAFCNINDLEFDSAQYVKKICTIKNINHLMNKALDELNENLIECYISDEIDELELETEEDIELFKKDWLVTNKDYFYNEQAYECNYILFKKI